MGSCLSSPHEQEKMNKNKKLRDPNGVHTIKNEKNIQDCIVKLFSSFKMGVNIHLKSQLSEFMQMFTTI